MPIYRTQKTQPFFTEQPIRAEEFAYYSRRLQNRIFNAIVTVFAGEAKAGRISRAELAARMGKDRAQISRWLAGPSNLTLDTISRILLSMGAELDDPKAVFLCDKPKPNYAHPLIDSLGRDRALSPQSFKKIPLLDETLDGKQSGASTTTTADLSLKA